MARLIACRDLRKQFSRAAKHRKGKASPRFVLSEKAKYKKQMHNESSANIQKRPPLSLPFYYGWFVISLCFLTTLTSAGVRSSPSVLIHPLEAEFGWSRTLIASAVSMNLLLFGIAAPLSGFLIDRFGPRKVMMGSLALLIAGVSGTIVMTQFWQFFLVWGVIVTCSPVPISGAGTSTSGPITLMISA